MIIFISVLSLILVYCSVLVNKVGSKQLEAKIVEFRCEHSNPQSGKLTLLSLQIPQSKT